MIIPSVIQILTKMMRCFDYCFDDPLFLSLLSLLSLFTMVIFTKIESVSINADILTCTLAISQFVVASIIMNQSNRGNDIIYK